MLNISQIKGNQTMKFGQLIEYNRINISNETGRLVRDLFLFVKKALYKVKQVACSLVSLYFNSPYETWRLLIQRQTQFWFFRKVSGNSFSAIFCVWLSTKMFLKLYSITWSNFIVRVSLLLEILGNMCIAIVC